MKNKMSDRVTIKEIAEIGKVSTATVSKVLNNKCEHISVETIDRIHKISDELGYIPNPFAKGLKNSNSKILGLILPDINNAFPEMAKGAEDEAARRGYCVIFCSTNGNQVQGKQSIKMLISKMTDGIIYVSSNMKENDELIIDSKIPFVVIDRSIEQETKGSVLIDNYQAMLDVADFMVQNKCRRIAYVTADIEKVPSKDRFQGFIDGLAKHDIVFDKKLLYLGDFSVETGYMGAMKLYQREKKLDSIVCGNDLIAIGVINALQKMNVKIPEQVKVMGFDDVFMAKYTNPELTTVRQNAYEMGRKASQMLIDYLEFGTPLSAIILKHEIIQRGSI